MKATCRLILWISLLLSGLSCVSVNIKPKAPTRSNDYKFLEPSLPFVKMEHELADHAWQNPRTGNTMAVLSECSEQKDPSLSTLEGETIQALNNDHVLSTQELNFQDRAARRSVAEGTLDGIAVKMEILVVKKNSCAYTLTYMGRASGFQKDQAAFEKFIKGFEIP